PPFDAFPLTTQPRVSNFGAGMNPIARVVRVTWVAAALLSAASVCHAQSPLGSPFGFTPRVPVSAFARPASWFDPSRLHVSTSFSVGSGWGSGATEALQTTSFQYQFSKPAWLEVSLGNNFGKSAQGSSFFLEGLRFGLRPTANSFFSFEFRNVRSPLQLTRNPY